MIIQYEINMLKDGLRFMSKNNPNNNRLFVNVFWLTLIFLKSQSMSQVKIF